MGGTMGEMTLTPCSFVALLKVLSLIRVIRTVSTFASARRAARSFLGRMGVLLGGAAAEDSEVVGFRESKGAAGAPP